MSQHNDEDSYGGITILLSTLLFIVLVFVVTEFMVVGAIAWKWGQKQTWTIYDRLNGFLASISAIFLLFIVTTFIGGGIPFFSEHWFEKYFLGGLWTINIGLICFGVIITLLWFVKWLFTPSGQKEKLQSPKDWIINYLQS